MAHCASTRLGRSIAARLVARASLTFVRSTAIAIVGALVLTTQGAAQATQRAADVSLDSLLNTRVSVAAKYLQTSAEVAASITIVSAEDIRRQGYSNLLEVLESVPGMYVSNDRNYPYLGTRGFGRPSDYNNRILVLVDGHTLNEQVWGSAPVGTDLPINLDAVERVEVVRGPGSVLYGSSAMFAVINVVTKTGTQTNGVLVSARAGSGAQRQAAVNLGYPIGAHASFAISALATRTNGNTLYYPEYQSGTNARGAVRNLDWENGASVLAALTTGAVTTRVAYRSRSKGIPTGSYGMIFGDDRANSRGETVWGEVSARGTIGPSVHTLVRLYGNRTLYHGEYPYDSGPVFADRGISSDVGTDLMVMWDGNSRNRLTVGTEFRKVFTAEYATRNLDGEEAGDNAAFGLVSFLVQDELQLLSGLKLVGGLRFDQKIDRWNVVTPRLAIIATPSLHTTVKLLYGEAYRAPSVSESEVSTDYFKPNPQLRAERIATWELAAEQRLSPSILVNASGYQYAMRGLIELVTADTMNGFQFRNEASTRGRGLELGLTFQSAQSPVSLRWWYAAQQTRDDSTNEQLTNSPRQTLNAALSVHGGSGAHAALTVRNESGRRTLNGTSTPAYTRTDLNVGYAPSAPTTWRWLRGTDISIRASNLFNTRYSVPGGLEHRQQSIEQDGRMFSLRLRREF